MCHCSLEAIDEEYQGAYMCPWQSSCKTIDLYLLCNKKTEKTQLHREMFGK